MISLLDCTLRDGGHINDGDFSHELSLRLISGLAAAGVDMIEFAQLGAQFGGRKSGSFRRTFSDLDELVAESSGDGKLVVMLRQDWQVWDEIPAASENLSRVRLAFRKKDLPNVELSSQQLKRLGYTVSLNPIDTPSYSFEELKLLTEIANITEITALSVVDTYGSLVPSTMRRLLQFMLENLRKEVSIGFHLHDNLLLASSHLFQLIEASLNSESREFIIDASLVGLGRPPGNLKLELAAMVLNKELAKSYDMKIISKLIDQEVLPIRNSYEVVYEPVYAFSAFLGIDRTFAEFLSKELGFGLADSFAVLSEVNRRGFKDFSESSIAQVIADLREG